MYAITTAGRFVLATAVATSIAAVPAITVSTAAQATPAAQVATAHSAIAHSAIVTAWEQAWSGTDPARLGRLFTADGVYTDHAIGVTMNGRDQISGWKQRTDQMISDVQVRVLRSFRSGNHITIESIYSGHIKGAPTPFAVPICTVLDLRHGKIAKNQDYYSLASVLAQSGLPADWTPGRQ
ncbi:nuclear transport factor 2 family protein [Actinoplanes sp. CA-252034]|uniref:nuclear transport factor 2 family protein n=1 Tax=Actinoplanes sp. CA-252034 TaxID=3239906 RepID=UPI003D99F095